MNGPVACFATREYHLPSPISDDLSRTNPLVFEPRSKLIVIYAHGRDPSLRYFAGSNSGVTGAGLLGALLGGGGTTGSAVGDTGSSSGTTV